MHKPKAVIFDLGKVLLDFDYEKLARNMQQHCAISAEELLSSALCVSGLQQRYESGLLTSQAFFEEVKRISGFQLGYEKFEPLFADIFTPIPGMIDLQRRLQIRGIPTYIFSNTNEIAVKHIRQTYPFFANFTGYVYSYEQRSLKPDPRIYEAVEKLAKHNRADLLYLDDRAENIDQGKARGWQVIQHVSTEETVPQVEQLLA
jgi:FMN phosphatase YigB (HAD superfamily)